MRTTIELTLKTVLACTVLVAYAALCLPVKADFVVFEQLPGVGSSNTAISSTLNNFGNMPGFITADNFELGTDEVISGVNWWGQASELADLGGFDFEFTFYADAAGLPGAIVHSTSGTFATEEVNTGSFFDPVDFYQADLDKNFAADANTTYWVSVFNQAPDAGWLWLQADFFGDGSVQGQLPVSTWPFSLGDRAFQLESVPEPTLSLLLLIGGVGVSTRRRRRK